MAMLYCDLCGGNLVMGSGGVATCDCCGMVYSADRIREKYQGIKCAAPVGNAQEADKTNSRSYSRATNNVFKSFTLAGIVVGFFDIYISTKGFSKVYRGILESIVGHKAYTSAYSAAFIWIIVSLSIGFIAKAIANNILDSD